MLPPLNLYTHTPNTSGDATTAKKAEKQLSEELEKENRPSGPKRRKVFSIPASSSGQLCQIKQNNRRSLKSVQSSRSRKRVTPDFVQPDFEVGCPAPGLSPPPLPLTQAEEEALLGELMDSAMSEEIPIQSRPLPLFAEPSSLAQEKDIPLGVGIT